MQDWVGAYDAKGVSDAESKKVFDGIYEACEESLDVRLNRRRASRGGGKSAPRPNRRGPRTGPLFLAFLLLAGCDDAPGEWAAIVYPDRTDRTQFVVTPRFKTFSYCRDQAIERMKAIEIKSGGGLRMRLSMRTRRRSAPDEYLQGSPQVAASGACSPQPGRGVERRELGLVGRISAPRGE